MTHFRQGRMASFLVAVVFCLSLGYVDAEDNPFAFLSLLSFGANEEVSSSETSDPVLPVLIDFLPTFNPTDAPSSSPSSSPTVTHSTSPSSSPSVTHSTSPTTSPSIPPSKIPTSSPTVFPSPVPTLSTVPSTLPSLIPSITASGMPSSIPSVFPTTAPSNSGAPSNSPSLRPSLQASESPSSKPSSVPSLSPTKGSKGNKEKDDSPEISEDSVPPSSFPSSSPSSLPSLGSAAPTVAATISESQDNYLVDVRLPIIEADILMGRGDSFGLTEEDFAAEFSLFLTKIVNSKFEDLCILDHIELDVLSLRAITGSSSPLRSSTSLPLINIIVKMNGYSYYKSEPVPTEEAIREELDGIFTFTGDTLLRMELRESNNTRFHSVQEVKVTIGEKNPETEKGISNVKEEENTEESVYGDAVKIGLIAGMALGGMFFVAVLYKVLKQKNNNRQPLEMSPRQRLSGAPEGPPLASLISRAKPHQQQHTGKWISFVGKNKKDDNSISDLISMDESSLFTSDTEAVMKRYADEPSYEYCAHRLDKVIDLARKLSDTSCLGRQGIAEETVNDVDVESTGSGDESSTGSDDESADSYDFSYA